MWNNGKKYEGQFENDCQHGMGTCYYMNGKMYVGQWKNGLCHGEGDKNFLAFFKEKSFLMELKKQVFGRKENELNGIANNIKFF